MNIKQLAQRIPWIVALPVFAVAITGILLFLAAVQEEQFWTEHPGFTDTPMELQTPAELFAELLNGPSFLFNLPVHGIDILGISVYTGRLPAVAIFWTWIGWAVDRRLRDAHWLLVKPLWLRRVSYVALLAFAVFFIWAMLEVIASQQLLPSKFLWAYLGALKLHASVLRAYAMLAWAVAYALYLGRKILTTFKPQHSAEK